MSAKYTWSAFQERVINIIETADRSAPDFYVTRPITIDCSADGEAFHAVANIDAIRGRSSWRPVESVSALSGGARTYAREKLREHYDLLDAEARALTREFLLDWMLERGRLENQASKRGPEGFNFPILGSRSRCHSTDCACRMTFRVFRA